MLSVLIKPASSLCNLHCTYCFYLAKAELYPWSSRPKMSLETFEAFMAQYASLAGPHYSFLWQGGEPTIMGLAFFQEVVTIQERHARRAHPGRRVVLSNAIQTNATLLDEEWARFLRRYRFLVGVSIDGPPEWHDAYRVDWKDRATHRRVMEGVALLRLHGVPFNVLTVVTDANVHRPRQLLRWMVEQGFTDLQFIPCVEPAPGHRSLAEAGAAPGSITPEEYGRFLNGLFDAWLEVGVDRVRIRLFDNMVQMLWGRASQMCQFAPTCGYIVLEHNGDCYPCDFFVEGDLLLGNVHRDSLAAMVQVPGFRAFAQAKAHLHPDCRECPWLTLCYGECPRYRLMNAGRAEGGLPYFCDSYKDFFARSYRRLEQVAAYLGRRMGLAVPPSALPVETRTRRPAPPLPTGALRYAGRNDPCPCGSGYKTKRCCGAPAQAPRPALISEEGT